MPNASEDSSTEDIWALLEQNAPATTGAGRPVVASPPAPTTRWSRLKRWTIFRLLNAAAVVAWLYVLLKLFVFDLDHALVTSIPVVQPLLDFRVFVFLFVGELTSIGVEMIRRLSFRWLA
jgi:hypothetical protein